MVKKHWYELNIYLEQSKLSPAQIKKYYNLIVKQTEIGAFDLYIDVFEGMDAGVDLYVPETITISSNSLGNKIDHGIKASMNFITYCSDAKTIIHSQPSGYYLYPRSSMGAKTPLRLSNSVGIIDAGYRGSLIGLFDNICNKDYEVKASDRLLQICAPNITYPIKLNIVDDVSKLGTTQRNDSGFGSSGR